MKKNWLAGYMMGVLFFSITAKAEMPVIDWTSFTELGIINDSLGTNSVLDKDLFSQLTELQTQTKRLESEINGISKKNFTQSEITSKLNEVDGLIKQASSQDGGSYKAGTSQFSKNYPGYNTIDNINSGTSYDDFYKNNANTTLATMDNSIQAIETDKANNTGTAVDDTIAKARSNILAAEGTTQAVSSLAEINIEILKQLQSMHMQLAAMAETQNAASAKEIQEKATEKAEVTKDIAKDAEWVSIDSGKSVDKLKF